MSQQQPRNPTSWDEYEGRPSSEDSRASSILYEEQALLDDEDAANNDLGNAIDASGRAIGGSERRRSSVTNRISAMADIGGVNSFRSFARSWQRAAAFPEVIPRQPSLIFSPEQQHQQHQQDGGDGDEALEYGRSVVQSSTPQFGLLRQHLEASSLEGQSAGPSVGSKFRRPSVDNDRDRDWESKDLERACEHLPVLGISSTRSSIFAAPPHLATPSIIGSYGSHYGTMTPGSLRARPRIIHPRGQAGAGPDAHADAGEDEDTAHGEEQPILVREVRQGNKLVLTVEGQSTLPQSVFNSINAIIGVGLLSLPLALKMSGWLIGLPMLTITAAVTAHTANLLAKCMDYDPSLITYSDIAFISFGTKARVIVSALFTLELLAACVAMIILFSDSLGLLLPSVATVTTWKCFCAAFILVLNVLPLRWLSYTSIVGICSTFCIVCIVAADGLTKPDSPGSLRQPAATYLLPSNWYSLPLAYGLMLSPWGAHSVFPSIYRDMRHPYKWGRAYVLDTCLAIIGILMFGDGIGEAITNNIIQTPGYAKGLTVFMTACVAVIPLTKLPLNARPLITTADVLCGLHLEPQAPGAPGGKAHRLARPLGRALIRVAVVCALLAIAILFPSFDSVCAFLGAALCSLISVVLPISFHLKLFWKEIPARERIASILLLAVFSVFGMIGTVWTFLPKTLVGA
ncbi:Vacuolar amino acid transporter 1 [Escovopsis weberi]|uniref:Vacuolar amino acid transporter 1 n=1 Tax=Escovopsis weberi TaxID=150374 RepID=A0A0M9VRH6_ESCWE|nr:Vacuolar amino acid transporter 1 [Escovopsis weberi]